MLRMNLKRSGLVALSCVAAVLSTQAQTITPRKISLRDLLILTSHTSDFEGPDGQPFRLKAKFETYDWKGKPAGEGALEETWLKPGFVRRTITFRGVTRTQVSAGGGVRSTGDHFAGSFVERRLIEALLNAVPSEQSIHNAAEVAYRPLKLNNGTLDCVILSPLPIPQTYWVEGVKETAQFSEATAARTSYCVNSTTHVLRVVQERFDAALTYDDIERLGTHALGKKISLFQGNVKRGTLVVTSLQPAVELKESDFNVPANATNLDAEDIELPEKVMAGSIIKKLAPVYPDSASERHISGQVILDAVIGKEGTIKELDLVSSPDKALTESAMYAVQRWIYHPYLVNGTPTEVQTKIVVTFSIMH